MPPRLSLRPVARSSTLRHPSTPPVCLFCSIATTPSAASRHPQRKRYTPPRRAAATAAAVAASPPPPSPAPADPRRDLEDALGDLQKHAPNYVNLSRVQLAINGLRQSPGTEAIRVAILAMNSASDSAVTARRLARLLLADPLSDKETWEDQVEQHDLAQPMLIQIGPEETQTAGTFSIARGSLLHEVHVSSAMLNDHNLELMLMESNPLLPSQQTAASINDFEESILVPIIDIPTSSTGRFTSVTTPVHTAIVVASGILGAASVTPLASDSTKGVITAAVDLPEYKPRDGSSLPFVPIDVGTAARGLELVRKDIAKAIDYEHLWFQSNIPQLSDWLKSHTSNTPDGTTKPPIRTLISSILRNASAAVQSGELNKPVSTSGLAPATSNTKLQGYLDDWAENAHRELQEQLDMAFESTRWRKLGWWKLFWRVDDVGFLTTDILNQRYLAGAERNAIFLAGRMAEAGVPLNSTVLPSSAAGTSSTAATTPGSTPLTTAQPAWPVTIPASRNYLQSETIPALQSLAQNLVVQTLSTSTLTSALGALAYFGTLTTSIYEAGAIAALGVVWSLRRLQTKWEAARHFWEGEVREEGRKAVRGVEGVIGQTLYSGSSKGGGVAAAGSQQQRNEDEARRQMAKEIIRRAQDALQRLK